MGGLCMKGNEKIIEHLNARLADELTAINQYMVHAEMCENWNYKQLDEMIQKRAIAEMRHAEKLIARILFLKGNPSSGIRTRLPSAPKRQRCMSVTTEPKQEPSEVITKASVWQQRWEITTPKFF